MSQQPIYFWQLVLFVIGVGLVLHSAVSKEALLAIGEGKAVRFSESMLGLAMAFLALSKFLH